MWSAVTTSVVRQRLFAQITSVAGARSSPATRAVKTPNALMTNAAVWKRLAKHSVAMQALSRQLISHVVTPPVSMTSVVRKKKLAQSTDVPRAW